MLIEEENVCESANQLKIDEVFEQEIDGLFLIVGYHAPSNSFVWLAENKSNRVISRIGVEIYLSNAVELGPTKPFDLQPGESRDFSMPAYNKYFKEWNMVVGFHKK